MQYINGHKVRYYHNVYDCWVVDDHYCYYSLETLASVLGLSYDQLIAVLHA